MLSTTYSWIQRFLRKRESIALTGVILFIAGLLITPALPRLLLFIASLVCLAYIVFLWIVKPRVVSEQEEDTSQRTTGEQNQGMKKLIFDDFQQNSEYKVEVVDGVQNHKSESTEKENTVSPSIKEYEFNLSDFFDINEEVYVREGGPKSEFGFLLKKVLLVIKEVHFAHTVAFFWVNREKNQIVLESFVSDSERFMTHRRRELGSDMISQVALAGRPKLITSLNTSGQGDILGYYDGVEPVMTFVAIPIFYVKGTSTPLEPVAVLSIDCIDEDAYGPETLSSLGKIAKLISALIRSYTDKYDLLLDSELLRSITRVREQMHLDFTLHNVVRTLAEEVSRLVTWDYITVVLYDENRKAWIIQCVMNRMNDPYVPLSQEIDPVNSSVGSVIQSGVPKIIDQASALTLPRYYRAERIESDGSLAILPIASVSRCYGALVVESKDTKTYSEADVKLLQKLVETASYALEIFNLTDMVNNYVLMDETTGVAARKYFMTRVQEEVVRAADYNQDLSMVMIAVDSINEHLNRYGKDGFEFVLQNVGRMISASIRQYDLVGRFDYNRFGVMLINTTAKDAQIWAEKLRKNIASNVINIELRSFSVTVSIGICGAASNSSDIELLENASLVLRKAIEAGGNVVRYY
ncbi:MAG: sensor domain-containing diguanylate cyclase [bacterium]